MRPANIVTSVADVLAGMTIAGFFGHANRMEAIAPMSPDLHPGFHFWMKGVGLCVATIGLYGGGVVFNDVFDARLDAVERPERPIPSGLIPIRQAALLGTILLLLGVLSGLAVNPVSALLAAGIAAAALIYDKWGKHQTFLGPLNMGICRGLNLLLGMSVLGNPAQWWIAIIPVLYIAAITAISRGEVHGGKKNALYLAFLLYLLVIGCILYVARSRGRMLATLPFLLFFSWMIFKPLLTAIRDPIGRHIGQAVKAGVIALIIMNASWAAAFGEIWLALAILVLLPLSLGLARLFAVT
jgi:4-hydroxybenzoate polyprenyltransferase